MYLEEATAIHRNKNPTLSFGRMVQQLTTKNVLKNFLMTMRFHTLLKIKILVNHLDQCGTE